MKVLVEVEVRVFSRFKDYITEETVTNNIREFLIGKQFKFGFNDWNIAGEIKQVNGIKYDNNKGGD